MIQLQIKKSHLKAVFILEDDEYRIKWFKEIFKDVPTLYITKQPGTAIEVLNQQVFDILFLDHDLENDAYEAFEEGREPQKELTGLYVAEQLKDTKNRDTHCIIHSMNPSGAANMAKAHPFNTYQIPYYKLVETMELI